MICPHCQSSKLSVVDSRIDTGAIRRRRECQECNHRFTTYERVEQHPPMVVKKDGSRQAFDRKKIEKGILQACAKRPITAHVIERAVEKVVAELLETHRKEVSSEEVGDRILEALKSIDEIAYVRFASVYREFDDIRQFIETLSTLETREKE